jgi:fucose permease
MNKLQQLLPVLFGFFVMGFCDMVGVSVSYVKADFTLSDSMANLLPLMVFIWFAVFSLPTGVFMGKYGRRFTVLVSAVITFAAMLLPLSGSSFAVFLVAFALLGIGNTVLQVSLNPLVSDVVEERKLTGMLTLGQFIKAVSAFLGPILIGLAAKRLGSWTYIFPTYAALTAVSFIWLYFTRIEEGGAKVAKQTGFGVIVGLMGNRRILAWFSIILLIVGFEVGLLTALPKFLEERCSLSLEDGALYCSLYFAARTLGTFLGSFLLVRVSPRKFLLLTLTVAIICLTIFAFASNIWVLRICLFIVGLTCANVFAIVFATAIQSDAPKADAISALMIMGVAGGALLPPLMGVIADASSQFATLFVPIAALIYILIVSFFVIKKI